MAAHWDKTEKRWVEHLCGNCALWAPNLYDHLPAESRGTTCCADAAMDLPASFIPARQTMEPEQGADCICWEPIDRCPL